MTIPSSNVIYTFGGGTADGDGSMLELLGGKGAKLAELSTIGVNVPHGLTIPTTYCVEFLNKSDVERLNLVRYLVGQHVMPHLKALSRDLGYMPLLSVRSGARVSMAGMMDTVLNVGMTSDSRLYWEGELGEWAAADCARRFKMMYADVVLGANLASVKNLMTSLKEQAGVTEDHELSVKDIDTLSMAVDKLLGLDYLSIPDTLETQLEACVYAVFMSWNTDRAKWYRKMNNIPNDWGTAVTIQMMVFGNANMESGSGVLFTANPSTGEWADDAVVGEYLPNAQGEDVVSGIRTPYSLTGAVEQGVLDESLYESLIATSRTLESHFNDMQDIEFTIQNGELFVLQTRDAKRTATAALTYAMSAFNRGDWDSEKVRDKLTVDQLLKALQPVKTSAEEPIYTAIGAGGSIATGVVATTVEEVREIVGSGKTAIFVAEETNPNDIEAMSLSAGILTTRGGLTSHAAVVARGMNVTCVVGCKQATVADLKWYGTLSLDGITGEVFAGEVTVSEPDLTVIDELNTSVFPESIPDHGDLEVIAVDESSILYAVDELVKADPTSDIVVQYHSNNDNYAAMVFGAEYIPTGLHILCRCMATRLKDGSHTGSLSVACPNEYVPLVAQSFPEIKLIHAPESVKDLLSMSVAYLQDDDFIKIFGSADAAKTVLQSLAATGVPVAKNFKPLAHPIKLACSNLLGE